MHYVFITLQHTVSEVFEPEQVAAHMTFVPILPGSVISFMTKVLS